MRGIQGLILALGLGIAAALLNWTYLTRRAADQKPVEFLGIAADQVLSRGDRLKESDLVPVGIPRENAVGLRDFVFLYEERHTVVGQSVWRTLSGGSLLLRDDLKTPPQELMFGQDRQSGVEERALWIPVDTRTFVPSLVVPGDQVSFVVYRSPAAWAKPPADPAKPVAEESSDGNDGSEEGASEAGTPRRAGPIHMIGPFKILSLGNRLGSAEVMRAAKVPQVQENVMTIAVRLQGGRLEPRAEELMRLMQSTNFRPLGILLHPRKPAVH